MFIRRHGIHQYIIHIFSPEYSVKEENWHLNLHFAVFHIRQTQQILICSKIVWWTLNKPLLLNEIALKSSDVRQNRLTNNASQWHRFLLQLSTRCEQHYWILMIITEVRRSDIELFTISIDTILTRVSMKQAWQLQSGYFCHCRRMLSIAIS